MNQIAQKLKEENIAEYLIYMWQEEDLIRANHDDERGRGTRKRPFADQ